MARLEARGNCLATGGKADMRRTELVRARLVRRHCHGYRIDHANRGAQRQAVYTITEEARAALRADAE